MPELPDVETFKRYLDATALHQPVRAVHVRAPALLEAISASQLGRRLHGRTFTGSRRHGKFLFVGVQEDGWLVLHFGMTGWLDYAGSGGSPEHTDLLIEFDNGYHLAYVAPRKLGRIGWTEDPDAYIRGEDLGPDALDLDPAQFRELAGGRRGGVKCWLMNQSVMAGIGNVYSDEIVFQARLHPKTDVRELDASALKRLFEAMGSVLQRASQAKAEPANMPADFLLPHRHENGTCPRCRAGVASIQACGRTAWYCPRCQVS